MGFSANQARFLTLTSRQVDLEYRMQQICHRRIRLASELEKIATDYNNKMSDRKLYTMNTSQSISDLSVSSIKALTDTNNENYIVYYQNKTGSTMTSVGGHSGQSLADDARFSITTDAELTDIISDAGYADKVPEGMSNLEYALRTGLISVGRVADTFTQEELTVNEWNSTTVTALSDKYEQMDWRTMTEISDELYDGNNVDAEAEYENAIEKINAQDKKLQLEQSQIEVEHKAIVTQKDSVKSIIDKNIEKSFKTFG